MSRSIRMCLGAMAILLAACGQFRAISTTPAHLPQSTPTAERRPATPTPFISPVTSPSAPTGSAQGTSPLASPAPSWPAEADAAVRAAVNDLAARLKAAPEKVQVISVSATDWPDTSLGCPKPGMFYAQVIVEGYKIVLAAGRELVEYHSDKRGRVVTCSK
jgi:hypothetical protein